MEINEKLKKARSTAMLTQEQIAEKLMVSRQTISNWENGKSLPDIVSVMKLSDLYQISLDELLKGDQKMKEKMVKDAATAKKNERVILIGGVLVFIVGVIYFVSTFVGGDFYDFCNAAITWVLIGIGVACFGTYSKSDNEK